MLNRRWVLARRPDGVLRSSDFERSDIALGEISEGEVRVRVTHLSFAPTQRIWIERDSYLPAVPIGGVVRAFGVGEVTKSNLPEFSVGDVVEGGFGWQDYWQGPATTDLWRITRLPKDMTPEEALGVFGVTSTTAWFGVEDILRPQAGETALVSAAAGATGSAAGQILKAAGVRVIGIAGGPDKARWVTEVAGFDACIDYRHEDVSARIRALAPGGVDMVYENVGGAILDAALENLALHARIAFCGAIAGYDGGEVEGLKRYLNLVVRRATITGFLVQDYKHRNDEAVAALKALLAQGRFINALDVQHGFERIPDTLGRLFAGKNLGKQILIL